MKKLLLVAIAFVALFASCKKKDVEKTTQEKVLGRWKVTNQVTKSVYNGITSNDVQNGAAADYFDFRNDGKVYSFVDGELDTASFKIISDIKIQFGTENFDILTLNNSQFSVYNKYVYPNNAANYYESTINLAK
jgi:hypothetical protein